MYVPKVVGRPHLWGQLEEDFGHSEHLGVQHDPSEGDGRLKGVLFNN